MKSFMEEVANLLFDDAKEHGNLETLFSENPKSPEFKARMDRVAKKLAERKTNRATKGGFDVEVEHITLSDLFDLLRKHVDEDHDEDGERPFVTTSVKFFLPNGSTEEFTAGKDCKKIGHHRNDLDRVIINFGDHILIYNGIKNVQTGTK
jgi:hypothetical protein